ncbi:MAG: nucleotide sugar dehydrogenase [Gammaproteobacteria bacterium]|nr:nucleotide sugar dehydrogenase [Gammaproteobacteria bacterium]
MIGIGRIGLCFALFLERAGYNVIGCDRDRRHVDSINNRTHRSTEPRVIDLLAQSTNFRATSSLTEAAEASHFLFVCVRTESEPDGKYCHSQIESMLGELETLGRHKHTKRLVICCNINPGYSDAVALRLQPLNYSVTYNPEWVRQGSILDNFTNPNTVVIGEPDVSTGDDLSEIYRRACNNTPRIIRTTRLTAEVIKIALNCSLAAKIALANMIGDLAICKDVDPHQVLDAIGSDPRIGAQFFAYGFGYGGPCLPRDTRAFRYCARSCGADAAIIEAVESANREHLDFQVERFCSTHSIDDIVLIDEVSYKPGVDILDDSQQLLFAVKIAQRGYKVKIRSTKQLVDKISRLYGDMFDFDITDASPTIASDGA